MRSGSHHPPRPALPKKKPNQKIVSGKDVEKLKHLCFCRMQNGIAVVVNSMVVPKKK